MAKIKLAKTEKVEEKKDVKEKKKTKNKTSNKTKISIVDRYRYALPDGAKQAIWVIGIVLIVFLIFYLITVFRLGGFKNNKKSDKNTTIQYQEILAGTSFNMNSTDYMVVYYDKSDTENEDSQSITSTVAGYDSESTNVDLYTCDLGNEFNKKFVTTESAHTNPFGAEDLLINGPTLIRFTNGELKEYIQGKSEVETYISDLTAGK
ncbi:MAG: hypothetical protein IJ193_04615 [Bacilli bacterium]|nr:hypothetical protein [Bacilli bacterium]